MLVLYNVLAWVALVLAAPVLLVCIPFSARARRGILQRLAPLPRGASGGVWLHAASVGEAESILPLVADLRSRGMTVRATSQTIPGRETLRRALPDAAVRLAPLDLFPLPFWSMRRVRPRVLVLVETEIWPNLVAAARSTGTTVLVASGRISDRTLPRYRAARPLIGRTLRSLDLVCARSEEDGRRFTKLGVPAARVRIVGDLKLDRPAAPPPSPDLCAALGPAPLLVAGSTHPGEEEVVLQAWARLRNGVPGLRICLAPRHVERSERVVTLARERGFDAAPRTKGGADAAVVVLDTIGELASVYGRADLVFVGGSLVPVGGHNLLEPVRAGRVVVHGPHVENQRSQVDVLAPLGVLHRVGDAGQLERTLEQLWRDPDRHRAARQAAETLERHRGAGERVLEAVLGVASGDAHEG